MVLYYSVRQEYGSLKPIGIVFVSLKGVYDKKKNHPQNGDFTKIYVNKKEAKAIVHAPLLVQLQFQHQKSIPAFHYMVAVAGGEDIKCSKYATFGTRISKYYQSFK